MTPSREDIQGPRDDRAQRRLLAAAVALFVISRIIVFASPWPSLSDASLYGEYALRGIDFGQVAYRDFPIEYPPLAWGLMALPRLLATEKCSPAMQGDALATGREAYRRTFRGMMLVVDLASLVLIWTIARRHFPARQGSLCLAYVAVSTSSLYLLYERLDLGLLLLLLLWALAWLRSIEERASASVWRLASYAVLGLSVAYKLIPILMLPYLLLADWQARPRVRVWPGVISFTAALAIPFLLLYPSAGTAPLQFLEYHRERGIQVESIYATLLTASSWLGVATKVVYTHAADEVDSAWAPAMKTLASVFLGGLLAGTGFWCLAQGRGFDRERAWRCAALAVLGAVALSPILSPQYFIWALPLALLVAAAVLPADGRSWRHFAVGVVVVGVLTMLVFPCTYFGLVDKLQPDEDRRLIPLARGLLALRNVAYIALVVWLGQYVFRKARARADRQFSSGDTLP
jgi:4-amino-4-deoxy-L-arabinose transferase-like glycosyltransferase